MSLLRLLTAGKSLVGLTDMDSRYRLTSQRLLPQFGSERNPFTRNRKTERAQPETAVTEEAGESVAPAEPSLVSHSHEQRPKPARAAVRRFIETSRLKSKALLTRCSVRLGGLLGRGRVKPQKPAIPRFSKIPVQGELSLDRIKVVRNDLSDADLQVVPASVPPAPAKPSPALPTAKPVQSEERRWGRFAAGLFGAGKT